MQDIKDRLIVALDVDTLDHAAHFVDTLYPAVKLFKIGSQLFTACGKEVVDMVRDKGSRVFLDLKFHDIPNTVKASASAAVNMSLLAGRQDSTIFMMTAHTAGGKEMLEAAVRGAEEKASGLKIKRPFIVGVTVLTSEASTANTFDLVLERALLAKDAGLDGIVCSAQEAAEVRKACGQDFIIVTPGIRPKGADTQDQKRIATAGQALKSGASFIVVGRPILEAQDPLKAARDILAELG
jgi:orotidine-5'-phosphate decarboxylase